MSAAEIVYSLPKLTESERRTIQQKLLELAEQDEDVAIANQSALESSMLLDRIEEKGASYE